jgi:hypothetical protein
MLAGAEQTPPKVTCKHQHVTKKGVFTYDPDSASVKHHLSTEKEGRKTIESR